MGLSIGQSAASLTRSPRVDVGDLARDATVAAARELRPGQSTQETERPGLRRVQRDPAKDRAVNTPGAALSTIDKGVSNARRLVPNVEDILDLARERFNDNKEARSQRLENQRAEAREKAAQRERPVLPDPVQNLGRFFGQQEKGPESLGLPQNPVGNENPRIQFSGAQSRPTFEAFA